MRGYKVSNNANITIVKFAYTQCDAANDEWALPLGVQILSIWCSLWENFAKSYVGTPKSWRPHLVENLDPPLWGLTVYILLHFVTMTLMF